MGLASIFFLLGINPTWAAPLSTAAQVMQVLRVHAPEIIEANQMQNAAEANIRRARQIPNPQISVSGGYGKYLGDTVVNGQADLTFVIETGGKRIFRIREAKGEWQRSKSERIKTEEDVLLRDWLNLVRLRQLDSEIRIHLESVSTFQRILGQYRRRIRLNPEQAVSLSVFELALSDFRLRESQLKTEFEEINHQLQRDLGEGNSFEKTAWVAEKETWPEIPTAAHVEELKGSVVDTLKAEVEISEALWKSSRAQVWPNLMIGPTYLPQVQGPLVAHQWGFNLGMEWPLWNFNGGGKRQKKWEWERAVHHLKSETHRLADEARHAETLYRREVELFKSFPLASFLEKQHQSQEAQYERGVIPSSLIIEAHRQLVDFTLQKHQAELRLWSAYWTVHRSRGNSIDILWNDPRKEVL